MTAVLFDTLRLSRTLRDNGHFTSEQAEALAAAFGEATHEDLATKADFSVLEAAFKSDFAVLEAAFKAEIGILKAEIGIVKAEITNLATKAELAEVKAEIAGVRAELKTDIAELKAELKTDIAEVKADILKWVVGAIGFQTVATLGTVVALVKIFAK